MKKINILSPGFTSPNSAAFLFPLIKFKHALKNHDFNITIYNTLENRITDCNFLLVDSKFFKNSWAQDFNGTLETISELNQKTKLIWCDQSDSMGTFLGQVLPYVYKYCKAQIIKDRSEYMSTHYASRIYADYYHKKYGINDKDSFLDQIVQNKTDLEKISVSWNSAFMNYGVNYDYILRLRKHIPFNFFLHFSKPRARPEDERPINFTCRMGISYARETICYQRKAIKEILKDQIPTDKLSRTAYFKEMDRSKICISPFGLGEITLKDFEALLSGTMLLKPDMSHMKTWPNLFQDQKTCLFHSWDADDIKEKIDWALSNNNERISIAKTGQNLYESHTLGKEAGQLFAEHFKTMLS